MLGGVLPPDVPESLPVVGVVVSGVSDWSVLSAAWDAASVVLLFVWLAEEPESVSPVDSVVATEGVSDVLLAVAAFGNGAK